MQIQETPEKKQTRYCELIAELKQLRNDKNDAENRLAQKKSEFEQTKLDKTILSISQQIEILKARLESATSEIANGEMSTEEFLKISSDCAVFEKNLLDLQAAKKMQDSVVLGLQDELKEVNRKIYTIKEEFSRKHLIENKFLEFFSDETTKKNFIELLKIIVSTARINEIDIKLDRAYVGKKLIEHVGGVPSLSDSSNFLEKTLDSLLEQN